MTIEVSNHCEGYILYTSAAGTLHLLALIQALALSLCVLVDVTTVSGAIIAAQPSEETQVLALIHLCT